MKAYSMDLCRRVLGAKLWRRNDLASAEPYYREALDIWRRTLPENHVQIASVIESVCSTLLTRDASQAELMLREAVAIRDANPGPLTTCDPVP